MVRLLSAERVTAEGTFGALQDLRLDPPPGAAATSAYLGGRPPGARDAAGGPVR